MFSMESRPCGAYIPLRKQKSNGGGTEPKGARPCLPRRNVMTPLQPELFDLYRAGLKGSVDWMKTGLENAERLQNQQLIAIRRAVDGYAKSAAELAEAKSVDELLAVHTRMAGAYME